MYKTLQCHYIVKTSPTILTRPLSTYACLKNNRPGFFTNTSSLWSSTRNNNGPSADEIKSYSRKTSKETASYSMPPARSTMLLRDFIDDALYNPHYGFYSKPSPVVEIEGMKQEEDHIQYMNRLAKSYGRTNHKTIHQLRYTLTEIFKPWYGYAIAKYMVAEYKLNLYPHKDLIIYEIGGGNGRLMPHILDYIERYEPSVYKRTQYNMIELSDRVVSPSFLGSQQVSRHPFVQVLDQNIFDWDSLVTEQCFFLGMEVINRFAHDVIRYDLEKLKPYQGVICVDEKRNYTEYFEPVGNDDTITRYLSLRKKARPKHHPLQHHPFASTSLLWHKMQHFLKPSLHSQEYLRYTYPEFIPTKLFQLMEILNTYFPGHRLILTDYDSLQHTIEGMNAPLVQTMFRGSMMPCHHYLMPPGWFDMVFPTNFDVLKDMYLYTCRATKAGNEKKIKSVKYDDFMERYGDVENSKSNKKGAPMRFMHQPNVKVFLT